MPPPIHTGEARSLLIALNATNTLSRGALCRLTLRLELWCTARTQAAERQAALRLGVPIAQVRRALRIARRAPSLADDEHARAAREAGRIVTLLDDDYPSALRDLPLPPPVLYVRGQLPNGPAIAIVGARKMDTYGRETTRLFSHQLAASGVTVVSGFALGVDTAAHRGALEAPAGHTVAVLGCGIDVDYPRRSRALAQQIAEQGAVISELPTSTEPRPWHFPIRNRIIAALGIGTLVIQAKARSGSLITAHHAMELGRDVYAVPGGIFDPLAVGPNGLIADGALVARGPQDVLESLSLEHQLALFPATPAETVDASDRDDTERPKAVAPPVPRGLPGRVLTALTFDDARSVDQLSVALEQPIDRLLSALLELELAGRVRRDPGPLYLRLM